jgi:hypothetical protein
MTITRREDGMQSSGIVYIRINNTRVPVSSKPFVGKTRADVIRQALGNAQVRLYHQFLTAKFDARV